MNTNSLAQCSSYFSSIMFGSIRNRTSKNYKIPKKKETRTLRCGLIRNKNISEVSEFSILVYTQNRKLGNLGKFYLLKFLIVYGTQNKKNDLKEKTLTLRFGLRRKMSISEISEFSILLYTWNRKLGNLGKFWFTLIFYCFGCIKHERLKPFIEFQIIKLYVLMSTSNK